MTDTVRPEKLDDEELYDEYQRAKEHGPQLRLDAVMREICTRWEAQYE